MANRGDIVDVVARGGSESSRRPAMSVDFMAFCAFEAPLGVNWNLGDPWSCFQLAFKPAMQEAEQACTDTSHAVYPITRT